MEPGEESHEPAQTVRNVEDDECHRDDHQHGRDAVITVLMSTPELLLHAVPSARSVPAIGRSAEGLVHGFSGRPGEDARQAVTAVFDLVKDGQIEGDDDEDWSDDGTEDEEHDVEPDVDVCHVWKDVTILAVDHVLGVLDNSDGEGGEGGEQESEHGFQDDHPLRVTGGDERGTTEREDDSDEPFHGERRHEPGRQQTTRVGQVRDRDTRHL